MIRRQELLEACNKIRRIFEQDGDLFMYVLKSGPFLLFVFFNETEELLVDLWPILIVRL